MQNIRERVPDITVRTTLLVGHPGETEEDHEALKDFVEEFAIDRIGVFTYSHEENTHAGDAFEDLIPAEVKETRKEEIMELQQDISFSLNQKKKGKVLKCLIDRQEDGYFVGRTEADSPEVDNEVIIYGEGLTIGEFSQVEITDALEYDLIGKVV